MWESVCSARDPGGVGGRRRHRAKWVGWRADNIGGGVRGDAASSRPQGTVPRDVRGGADRQVAAALLRATGAAGATEAR